MTEPAHRGPAPGLERLVAAGRQRLAEHPAGAAELGEAGLAAQVRAAAASTGLVLGLDDLLAVATRVRAEVWGLGPLQPLLADPAVTDVLVNGDDGVWVDAGDGLRRVDVDIGGEPERRALAVRLAQGAGRRLDEAAPFVDARLPGGIRLHAVLPPLVPGGTHLSLRVLHRRRLDEASPFVDARLPGGIRLHAVLPPLVPGGTHLSLRVLRRRRLDLAALVAAGAVPAGWDGVLADLVAGRAAFLVSGGTGAGKTTQGL